MLRHLYSRPDPSNPSGAKPFFIYRRRSKLAALWFFCLTLSVIAFSFCLGLMLGWSGAERTIAHTRRLVTSSQASAVTPRSAADIVSSSLVPVSLKSNSPVTAPAAVSPGDLVIYENGKEIFRLPPAQRAPNAKMLSKSSAQVAATKDQSPRAQ